MAERTRVRAERVEPWRRGLVVTALLASVVASVAVGLSSPPIALLLFPVWGALPALLLAIGGRGDFRLACVVLGTAQVLLGVLLFVFGVIIYVPSGLAVLLAGLAGRHWAYGLPSMLVGVLAVGGWTASAVDEVCAPRSGVYAVQFDGPAYRAHGDVLEPLEFYRPAFGHGATGLSYSDTIRGREWTVTFRPDASAQDRAALRDFLSGLPAVVSVAEEEAPYPGCPG